MRSPGLDQKHASGFAAELPTMEETREEHGERVRRESWRNPQSVKYEYNPRDFEAQVHAQAGAGAGARPRSYDAQFAPPPLYSAYNPQGQGR